MARKRPAVQLTKARGARLSRRRQSGHDSTLNRYNKIVLQLGSNGKLYAVAVYLACVRFPGG